MDLNTVMDEVKRILDANKTLDSCQIGYRYLRWSVSYYNTIDVTLDKGRPVGNPNEVDIGDGRKLRFEIKVVR